MSADPTPLIGAEQAALIEGRVSIIVGSRDAQRRPHLMRAAGAQLSPDRRRVTLLLPQERGRAVLDDLRDNGQIAVVFSVPSTHRTLQLKGSDAAVLPGADAALAERYLQGFVAEIGQLGFCADLAHTIVGQGEALVAVRFSVAAAFEQTPGPAAGQPLPRP